MNPWEKCREDIFFETDCLARSLFCLHTWLTAWLGVQFGAGNNDFLGFWRQCFTQHCCWVQCHSDFQFFFFFFNGLFLYFCFLWELLESFCFWSSGILQYSLVVSFFHSFSFLAGWCAFLNQKHVLQFPVFSLWTTCYVNVVDWFFGFSAFFSPISLSYCLLRDFINFIFWPLLLNSFVDATAFF